MNTIPLSPAVTINGHEFQPKVGMLVHPDGWRFAERLTIGDAYCDQGYPGSQFRLNTGLKATPSVPVNIEITARTIQWRYGEPWVRVRLEWVNDCAPPTVSGGWLRATEW